jgi:hypothetical protein
MKLNHIHTFPYLFVFTVLLFLAGCKPSVPSKYLSKGKMEDILYDYHIAQAMGEQSSNPATACTYRAAVFKKYHITQAQFDSSLVYYTRHTELLHGIYENLTDRLQSEAQAQGSSVNAFGSGEQGDTANIWRGDPALVLSPGEPFNYSTFSVPSDSSFHAGDHIILDFNAQFIFQDGMRDGVVVLAVKFNNDSIASSLIHIMNTQHYNLEVDDRDSIGIKSVKGYFLMPDNDDPNASMTTLKLMFIQNIKLVRMHVKRVPGQSQNMPSGAPQQIDSASPSPSQTSSQPQLQQVNNSGVPQSNSVLNAPVNTSPADRHRLPVAHPVQ